MFVHLVGKKSKQNDVMKKKVKKGRNIADKLLNRRKTSMGRETHVIAFFLSLSSIHVCLLIV
jgi:hypothetical protein